MYPRFPLALILFCVTSLYAQTRECIIDASNADLDFCTACSTGGNNAIVAGRFEGFLDIYVPYTIAAACLESISWGGTVDIYIGESAGLTFSIDPRVEQGIRVLTQAAHHNKSGAIRAYGQNYFPTNNKGIASYPNFEAQMEASAGAFRAAMPVELLDWRAETMGQAVRLSWTTQREQDNDYFVVEYRPEGGRFTELERQPGAGNSEVERRYATTHRPTQQGTHYYRLRQVDRDGTTTLFAIRQVQLAAGATAGTPVFPNPARVGSTLTVTEAAGQGISLHAPNGQQLLTVAPNEGLRQRIQLPTTLTPGIYVLRIGQHTERLLIH